MKKTEKLIFLNKNQWGEKYEIKELRRGFAAHLLLRKEVLLANERNCAWLEGKKAKKIQADLMLEERAQKIYDKINNTTLFFTLKKNEEGKPLGSIRFKEISKELVEKLDFHCQEGQLTDFHPLNKLGENIIKIKLSNSLTANLKIIIK